MAIRVCVFDAYGTLFDVAAAARDAARDDPRLDGVWETLAADWRMKQLEYTWLRAVTGAHVDFWQVTQDGLDWALEKAALDGADLRARLLDLYRDLRAYPEVAGVLAALKADGCATAILSNGSPDMLQSAVASAGIQGSLDAVLSVEDVGVFKPSARVYDLVGARFDAPARDVLFVSSNGWDVCCAAAYGFRTVWANRAGLPVDRLDARPEHIVADLAPIPDLARSL